METKPIIIFDLETTGTDLTKDRIVQISAIKVNHLFEPISDLKDYIVNPGIPIPKEASDIHGITDEMIKDKPSFAALSKGMKEFFSGCDIAGFNSTRFDVPILSEEFNRCGISFPEPDVKLIDAYSIFSQKEKRDLTAALKFYCDENMDDAHNAANDVMATLKVLKAQISHYQDLSSMDINDLHDFCGGKTRVDLAGTIVLNESGVAVYNIGKDKGKSVSENPGFANWMLKPEQAFTSNTKAVVRSLTGKLF